MSYQEKLKMLSDWLTIEESGYSGGYQGFTTLYVTGDAKDVASYVEAYLCVWHPCGYGTHAEEVDSRLEGKVTFKISRSNSCE